MSEINETFQRLVEAWNNGDATAYAAQFTEDVDYVTFHGLHIRGRAELAAGHAKLFAGPLKGVKLGGGSAGAVPPSVKFLAPDVAVVVNSGGSSLPGQDAPAPERDSVTTAVVVRTEDRWLISAFQVTRRQAL
ncbi:SgcJ/EcaC family oxidoreductase [Crossiella sp. SN42]|uniref:SgcJ/EcaC family oxidoreductase n=1 Tax=Crossiella sp. SN42 TaxID=2944808 RepID=UPI00207CB10D|nr:SgcJ/EcaC family oxidoreductase [Crossiella sp. SN42]MCO1581025.1 SgcJ/EcaC family oxidoreductase [Crossiella sp. SN42]